ncbi:hypothetical protein [Nonomuraea typhae]|uniref:hypothetical protein n=1 Tax=Nonomuraea typhae TaxID=2603600 RepID=UPI0012F87D04|nr:hypothetical protein [Nonomuraea typhae]
MRFYSDRLAWLGLLFFAVVLAYGGGVVMFIYHAILLGEGGPAISHIHHWLLDSSAAFVGLTPIIAVIVPVAAWISMRGRKRQSTVLFALSGGVMFALVTAPGPFMHDALVGRGTLIANTVTQWWGNGRAPTPPAPEVGVVVDIARQVALGLPLYILLMGLALLAMRAAVAKSPKRAGRT